MAMPFGYVSPEQLIKDRADYARKGIGRGRPLVVLEYDAGIAFVADNPSTHLHKVAELYDRIAFAAVGKYSEFENLRVGGIRLADMRGYAYGREDVTSRTIANAYSQSLGQIFIQESKPYEVELCVAEVGQDGEPNSLYHVLYDGTVSDRKGWLAMGGQAEDLAAALEAAYTEGWSLDDALRAALTALRSVAPTGGEKTRIEVALLERSAARRVFRRLNPDEVARRTASPA